MHELACPSCNAASQFDLKDYLLMCPFCSATFRLDAESGKKEIYSDHYIVPNALDARQVKALVSEWISRLHHNPALADREYFVTDINGFSIPFWIISLEAHTAWKGLVKKQSSIMDRFGSNYLIEAGQFRRNFRWAISARTNLCEHWGMTNLHEPKEPIIVSWDGFPMDSTFSRGRIDAKLGVKKSSNPNADELSAYDVREFFEFKFANGLPILPIQVFEEEALRRARRHVDHYHDALAKLNVEINIDTKTELEIAGIQLIHLPFWHARYVYRPVSLLKHFHKTKEKNVILEGYAGGILRGEMPIIQKDKFWINSIVTALASLFFFFLGAIWHPAFLLIGLFGVFIAVASVFKATATVSDQIRRRATTTVQQNTKGEEQIA